MTNKHHTLFLILFFGAAILLSSCKKYLEIEAPATQLTGETVFKNDATAISAQLAIYAQMEAEGFPYSMIMNTGLSSDELANYSFNTNASDLFTNNLTADNAYVANTWNSLYKYIYEANAVLEGVLQSASLSESVKKQLTGEAKFTRAFCHFYLVNLFGDVPIAITTNYEINAAAPRKDMMAVYDQMIQDLNEAKDLLSENFLDNGSKTSTERVRPTKWAALALLSRAYLYLGKWDLAAQTASQIIANNQLFSVVSDLNKVFLKNSREAIWQLMAVLPNFNTYAGGLLILTSSPGEVALSPQLVNSFQATDKRKLNWIGSVTVGSNTYYYPYKYKVGQNVTTISEYTMVLRMGEIFLIRAEALARQNDLDGALNDLNVIRGRAGLTQMLATSQPAILDSISNERNAELFTEFGDRWLNLKRTGSVTLILQPVKGADWTPGTDELYPIPQQEIIRNPALNQNLGY